MRPPIAPVRPNATKPAEVIRRRTVLVGGSCTRVGACAVPDDIIGVETRPPVTSADIASRGHRIFICTTRRESEIPSELYSGRRGSRLQFASVDVVIPPTHEQGKVERPKRLPPNPNEHFVIVNPSFYRTEPEFREAINVEVRKRPRGRRNGLFWVHGYNTNMTDGVLRLAQFVEDSGYDGVPVLYSWASQAKLTGYVYDINSALIARDRVEDLPRLMRYSEAEGLDVIAHSMGNLVVMEAIRGVGKRGLFNSSGKLRNVILASPDIDIDLFAAQLESIPRDQRRFYVLTSSDDRALSISSIIARGPRVGQLDAKALTSLGVNVVDLSQVKDTSSIHHTKFVDSPEIVQLLGNRVLAGDSYAPTSGTGLAESIIVGATDTFTIADESVGGDL